jgi:hypothetical protein
MNYFAKRKPNDFNNKIKKVFNFLTLTGKYKIIGSASLKSILYANDYDLNEDYSKKAVTVYDKVYHIFREKFVTAKRNPNIFIIDFKCGEQDGSPIRWDYKSMMKGTQVLSNAETISFQDCLKMKSTIKLDIIALVNSVFLDITENYFLKLNSTSTFETSSKTAILKSIKTSYDEFIAEKEYFKALKRSFSFKSMKSPKKFKSQLISLIDFFNSPAGLVNKAKNDLNVLMILLKNKFRKPQLEDIKDNLQIIKQMISSHLVSRQINSICSLKSRTSIYKKIESLRNKLFTISNKTALDFIQQNKNLIL